MKLHCTMVWPDKRQLQGGLPRVDIVSATGSCKRSAACSSGVVEVLSSALHWQHS